MQDKGILTWKSCSRFNPFYRSLEKYISSLKSLKILWNPVSEIWLLHAPDIHYFIAKHRADKNICPVEENFAESKCISSHLLCACVQTTYLLIAW